MARQMKAKTSALWSRQSTEIEALLDAGAIENGHTVIALYWLLRHRADLRARWIEK